jgi:hypothetical protein
VPRPLSEERGDLAVLVAGEERENIQQAGTKWSECEEKEEEKREEKKKKLMKMKKS